MTDRFLLLEVRFKLAQCEGFVRAIAREREDGTRQDGFADEIHELRCRVSDAIEADRASERVPS